MRRKQKILPFILLNILISALTTLAVLWWWDHFYRPAVVDRAPESGMNALLPRSDAAAKSIINPMAEIEIISVIAPGDPANEAVLIKQTGEGQTWLTGWRLFDQNGNTYTFPELLLNQNGAVQVFTKAGVDTVIELYWGLQKPVWNSGETVTLADRQNNIRATFEIP